MCRVYKYIPMIKIQRENAPRFNLSKAYYLKLHFLDARHGVVCAPISSTLVVLRSIREEIFRFLKAYRNRVCRGSKVHRLIVTDNPGVELQSSRATTPLRFIPLAPYRVPK